MDSKMMADSAKLRPTCILLAAGYGSRIAGLTNRPKCLMEIAGKTLLAHHLEAWKRVGLTEVVLVLGYEAQQIMVECEKYKKYFNFTFALNEDYRRLGNTYSLLKGLERVNGAGLIFDADLVYHPEILSKFLQDQTPDQILVGPAELSDIECTKTLTDDQGNIRMTVDKRAISTEELKQYKFVGEAIGILKFSAATTQRLQQEAIDFLKEEKNRGLNWEHLLNRFLKNEQVKVHFTQNPQWVEIDTPEDFHRAKKLCEVWK